MEPAGLLVVFDDLGLAAGQAHEFDDPLEELARRATGWTCKHTHTHTNTHKGVAQTLAMPSLSGANSLKTTISSPKERARQAQKMAILCASVRGRSEGARGGARRVFFQCANAHENVFPKRRGVLRAKDNRQCVCARVGF